MTELTYFKWIAVLSALVLVALVIVQLAIPWLFPIEKECLCSLGWLP